MKATLWFIGGVIEALIYTLAVGLLSVQVSGALFGAVYDVNNTVVAVANPSLPILQYLAIAVLSLLIVYSVTLGTAALSRQARIGLTAGVSVGLLVFTVWSLTLRAAWINGPERAEGIPTGWDGWVLLGGSNSAVHLVLLIAIIALVLDLVRRNRDVEKSPEVAETSLPEHADMNR